MIWCLQTILSIKDVIKDIAKASEEAKMTFAEGWSKATGIEADAFVNILHAHRDVLLYSDFYREIKKESDDSSQLWDELTHLLRYFSRK